MIGWDLLTPTSLIMILTRLWRWLQDPSVAADHLLLDQRRWNILMINFKLLMTLLVLEAAEQEHKAIWTLAQPVSVTTAAPAWTIRGCCRRTGAPAVCSWEPVSWRPGHHGRAGLPEQDHARHGARGTSLATNPTSRPTFNLLYWPSSNIHYFIPEHFLWFIIRTKIWADRWSDSWRWQGGKL